MWVENTFQVHVTVTELFLNIQAVYWISALNLTGEIAKRALRMHKE
jgi:hypothetical protein